ncbi:SusE domain-containing protein [Saccharicrinis aurantiacus]|uniref:SusE domain-containing protein n=1 Tax=Saccharicrinis aurantiacus TaxID=1849719 RepID=UPI0009501E22|nr:SusE domain-containing protein [Saccharicrinis aurantiacus]
MKKLNYIYILLFTLAFLSSCAEVTEKPALKAEEAPVLQSPDGSLNYVLTEENENSPFETFIYSEAKYSESVVTNYTVEVASESDDSFDNKVDMQEPVTLLYQTISNKAFNLLLGPTGLDKTPEEQTKVKIRVRADSSNPDVATMYSDTIVLTVTPYDAVVPPIYVVGNACSADWVPADGLPLEAISAEEYQGTISLITGVDDDGYAFSFRFLGQNTDWNPVQWFYTDMEVVESVPSGLIVPEVNQYDETNFAPTEAGDYEILFNAVNKTVKFTKQ